MTAEEEQRLRAMKVRDADRGVDAEISRDIDLSNFSFTELAAVNVAPVWRGGVVEVGGSIVDGGGLGLTYTYSWIDVRIVAYCGSRNVSLHRAAIGQDAGAIQLLIDAPAAYKRIAALARIVIDGKLTNTANFHGQGPKAKAHAIMRFNRT
jgi:hypothetical protein